MTLLPTPGLFRVEDNAYPHPTEVIPAVQVDSEEEESALLKTIGLISAGLGAVALGLFVGRELRQRYKFNRRTPYEVYSHSADDHEIDFGLGI